MVKMNKVMAWVILISLATAVVVFLYTQGMLGTVGLSLMAVVIIVGLIVWSIEQLIDFK